MASFNSLNRIMIILCVLCAVILFSGNVNGKLARRYPGECKTANTRYRLPERCDTYVECINSKPTRKICHLGLYFYNITDVTDTKYPCEYLDKERCYNRPYHEEHVYDDPLCDVQFSQPQLLAGDDTSCNKYVECANGQRFNKTCLGTSAFNPVSKLCDWPGESPHCNAPGFCAKFGKGYNSETKMCDSDDK